MITGVPASVAPGLSLEGRGLSPEEPPEPVGVRSDGGRAGHEQAPQLTRMTAHVGTRADMVATGGNQHRPSISFGPGAAVACVLGVPVVLFVASSRGFLRR